MKAYAAINKDKNILTTSSSGGVFYALAKDTLASGGIVFGAAWTKDWLINLIRVETLSELPKLMGSKYIKANPQKTFQEAKEALDSGRLVLFSSTPCQILGLKTFLKKDYDNLILVDLACHGILPLNIWQDYLRSIQRPNVLITNINMRDKISGWSKYSFTVDYSDGQKLIENHSDNKYMKAFLCDKYLQDSCYDCKAKIKASDITLGDFWNIKEVDKSFYNDLGVSVVRINSEKGNNIFDKIKEKFDIISCKEEEVHNAGFRSIIKTKKETYDKKIFNKNIFILSLPPWKNCGGIMQAYALQAAIKNFGDFNVDIYVKKDREPLPFVKNNFSLKKFDPYTLQTLTNDRSYDIVIAGSDQVWRKRYFSVSDTIINSFLYFTRNSLVNRLSYAASFGQDEETYSGSEKEIISQLLESYSLVSTRELSGQKILKDNFNIDSKQLVDPTMLLTKEDYLELCSNIEKKDTLPFAYILDSTKDINDFIKGNKLNVLEREKDNLEDWLACFRDCSFVITDSFHGCVFSILFNKPFICIYNKTRGKARFDTINTIFSLDNNFVSGDKLVNVDIKKLALPETTQTKLSTLRDIALQELKNSLYAVPKKIILNDVNIPEEKLNNSERKTSSSDPFISSWMPWL